MLCIYYVIQLIYHNYDRVMYYENRWHVNLCEYLLLYGQ